MSKLIYSETLSKFKEVFPDWSSPLSSVYRTVAYTSDGYLYTHGKVYQMAVYGEENPWGLGVSLQNQQLSVTIAGATKSVDLPVIGVQSGSTNELDVNTASGIVTITHKDIYDAEQGFGPSASSSDTINIPKLVVSKTGHITSGSNISATLNRVKVTLDSNSTKVYSLFGTGASTQEAKYNSSIYANLTNGAFYATQFFQNGQSLTNIYAPKSHASGENIYGIGTGSLYGHVKLSDSTSSSSGTSSGIAATPQAVLSALNQAKQYTDSILQTSDAMIFVGTITGEGVIVSYNSNVIKQSISVNSTNISNLTNYDAGWTFKVINSGTLSGVGKLESGDMVICIKDYESTYKAEDWTAVQANVDGVVTTTNLTANTLVMASGTKTIQSLANGSEGQYLIINSSGIPQWTSVGTKMRAIKYNNSEFLASNVPTALNLSEGSGIQISGDSSSGTLTIKNTGVLNTYPLIINNGDSKIGEYQPKSKSITLKLNGGLKATYTEEGDIYTISHSSTGKTKTSGLYKFSVDDNGHVTVASSVTSLPNTAALKFLNNGGTQVDSYIGSTEKSLKFANGTDITMALSTSNNIITLTPSITHRYRPISFQDNGAQSSTEVYNNTNSGRLTFKAGEGIHITNASGVLTFTSEDSWRNITAIAAGKASGATSIGSDVLEFGNDFRCTDNGGTSVIQLGWTEISADGTITYVV